ncbi:tetracycline resistance MFS efflux pump [soil metagenome]
MTSPETDSKQEKLSQIDSKKIGTKALLLVFLTVFIDLVGFGLIIPVLPTYARELHASDTTVGFLMASYSVMQFIFTPFWGRLSDRVGRRPILLVSLFASSIGYMVWGFSNSLLMLFLARMIAGAGNANIAVAQAYVSDVTTRENRARGMGMVGAAFGLGFVLGPAIGGICAGFGLAMIGFVAAGFSLLDFVLTFFFLPEPPTRSKAGSERYGNGPSFYLDTIKDPSLKVSLAIFFISTFAFANMETTLVLLTHDQFKFTTNMNSWMFTYIGVLIVMVQGGMIHRLSKKYGEKKLIGVGTFLAAVGLLLTPATVNLVVLGLALALLAVGSGINNPSNQSMLSKLAASDRIGGVLGVGQSLATLGRILGPIVGASSYQYLGYSAPYVIGTIAMVSALALSFKLPDLPGSGARASCPP